MYIFDQMKKIVIIGNGISGITAARNIRKLSDYEITVISAETDHFFSRTAIMYVYMGHMKYENIKPYEDWFWKKNKIDLVRDFVEEVDTSGKVLNLRSGTNIQYDVLIIACGAKSNKFGWPGQDLEGVQGLYSYQDLQLMEKHTQGIKKAVIAGGGLIGIEMAEMLCSRNIPVTLLIREKEFWDSILPLEEAAMVSRHVLEHHIDLRKETQLKKILPDDRGRARAVVTDNGEEISCQFVGLTVGVSPKIDFLEKSEIETERGVLVNQFLETNIPEVYALGDCAQFKEPIPGRRPIEQVWYTGRMQGETIARTICGKQTAYQPGNWFNSAKFFDIEYQVYGQVHNIPTDEEEHFYWEHPEGKKSLRIVYRKSDDVVIGFNLMGIRYRHEVCDRWINEEQTVDYVLQHLDEANFDPEFFPRHEEEIVTHYNQTYGKNIKLTKKGLLTTLFS